MVHFASRMDLLKGSEIRELLKLTAQPDIISFAGGMPAPELFPVEQMMEPPVPFWRRTAAWRSSIHPPKAIPSCASRLPTACWPRTTSTPTQTTFW